ncbi:MAG: dTDP-4-dehydrorhamnose 3,5-epimerase [Psychroflexus halocasei]
MIIEKTKLKDCLIIKPRIFKDERGSFMETFRLNILEEVLGREIKFVQDNQSTSYYGSIRGLHLQVGEKSQAKLVRVVKGEVLDVVVDLRPDSPTFKQKFSYHLNDKNNHQLFVPKGCAHGFACLSEEVIFAYKCDTYYDKNAERGIYFADKDLNIDWQIPEKDRIISEKDASNPSLSEFLEEI